MSEAYNKYRQLIKQKKFREAVELAEREYNQGSKSNTFWLTQHAAALNRLSDYESAYKIAGQALSIDSNNPYAVTAAADSLLGSGKYQEAMSYYEETLENPKVSIRSKKGFLKCLAMLKNWQDILQRIAQWEMQESESIPWRVKALSGLEKQDEAIEACRRWLELKPHNTHALWELTELEIKSHGLDSVLEQQGRTARIPSLPPIYKEIFASLCRRAGKPEMALKVYKKMEAQGADSRVQQKQAFTLAKQGREQEAIPLLEELLRLEPDNKYLHASYAAACKRIGEVERATDFYNELLGLFPDEKALHGRIKGLHKKQEKNK